MELCGYDEEEASKSPPRESLRKLKVISNNVEIIKKEPNPELPKNEKFYKEPEYKKPRGRRPKKYEQ
jgi:hypothetical protein